MTYPERDPRSQLAAAPTAVLPGAPPATRYLDFADLAPASVSDAGSRSWIVRARNIVFVLTELVAGEVLHRRDDDEVLLVATTDDLELDLAAGTGELRVSAATRGQAVAVLPPGATEVRAGTAGRIVRLFATGAADLADAACNADDYREPAPATAVSAPWPEPAGGAALRVYPDVASVPRSPDRMGRIYRNRHAMVNVLYPRTGPRDPASLSPHHHDDFEQLSYADTGTFTHHVRTPWGSDRRHWRDDEHRTIGSPSLAIIPPPLVHTTEAVGDGENRLIDIFAGPREDFSARPGWVLNAEDYPAPGGIGG
ncbi:MULTISPECIES: hypothetical protein [Pseudonocardia]|uniref:Uncharacterized protein n=2 Tax=Pseudonocardia TaxID=1847 RepID=A0A1Y2N0F6_PSEAH|nr:MULTISPECIES: hypothetical protein [Pseudonocardia]OSY40388.1 hypothetical protein BG845_02792 [Pseudonocardia autotrophica]TDN72281.1 hypothetical protein C8E95_1337 [Pseudonocardia autotrophica]BBG02993.1 hypothetical protein Pdca_42020 [Pseudonocardia autotrophica]GEC25105.1 hypothetical protein PSA01_21340 [Pseudonocardia saturnea]